MRKHLLEESLWTIFYHVDLIIILTNVILFCRPLDREAFSIDDGRFTRAISIDGILQC
jgi:hypothetical protein